ncbi:MAG: DUF4880 domain-containing protein [Verrucomicrobiae bacterium]|nr:DUF4880 domain-containing protein [Verrucomicrobiae bacterium]
MDLREDSFSGDSEVGSPEAEAANWVIRHDRGLSREERKAFDVWLNADAGNKAAWAGLAEAWEQGDGVTADEAAHLSALVLGNRARRYDFAGSYLPWFGAAIAGLGMAACFWLVFVVSRPSDPVDQVAADARLPSTRILPDESIVRVQAGTSSNWSSPNMRGR